ncbi:transcription initiation protein SPT3 homolog isoform X2 [Venturia canescens]|uniref:transcription initiation protein SPT3 homolog isoform X2 n=1 Tax=Venturia canescens TaxID=32260 RepID=UPI001C9BC93D|nr:transcription initiation protein SPT3 homolog isoform X2 [Venturia canescens]
MSASFVKSSDQQDLKNEPINYIAEIRRMMYGFGDCPEPLMESAKIIEDVVHRQMRSNKIKLRRLLKYLQIKEFKASMHKMLESEVYEETLEDLTVNPLKKKRPYHKIIDLIDNTGELSDNQSAVDTVKHNRELRAEMISRKIEESRYLEYSRARCVSFANKNQHKFSSWIGCEGDMNISKQGYVVLGYLAYETVAEIIDLALLVRQDQNKIHGDSIDRLKLSYHNPYTYKPYQHSKGTVTKAITPSEITEALRRYWSPQLDITGPFHHWSMHRPHLKLLSC